MWKIREIRHENSSLDQLHVYSNRMSCRIYPNLGGSLQELIIDNLPVIDGIIPDEKGLEDYRNSFKSSLLFPFPNRVKDGAFDFGEKSYQLEINDNTFNHAIHGLVHDQSFTLHQEAGNPEKARVDLRYRAEGSHPGFPFAYELRLRYSFSNLGEVRLGFELINTGHQAFPFGLGWHPYFSSSNLSESWLSLEALDHFICPERMIPEEKEEAGLSPRFKIGDLTFDDGYSLVRPRCAFDTPDYRLALSFDSEEESFLQIYTPPHRKSLAIEPMTCVTDAFNNGIGLQVLDPGERYHWEIEMKIHTKT
jgi:aldose 1-epimerase